MNPELNKKKEDSDVKQQHSRSPSRDSSLKNAPLLQRTTSLEEVVENLKKSDIESATLSTRDFTVNQTLQSVKPTSEVGGINFAPFMDIASSFWSKKFEEKAQELQKQVPARPSFLNVGSIDNFNLRLFQNFPSGLKFKNPKSMGSGSHSQPLTIKDSLDLINFDSSIESRKSNELKLEPEEGKINWSSAQDELLLNLAYELKCDWKSVSKHFTEKNMTPKTLKARYHHLKTVTLRNKARFSNEEDSKVLKYYEIYGTNWRAIANMLPGRTATTVKNRFYSSLRDRIKASSDSNPSISMAPRRNQTAPLRFSGLEEGSQDLEETKMAIEESNMRKSKENSMKPRSMIDTSEKRRNEFEFECDQFFAFDSFSPDKAWKNLNNVAFEENPYENFPFFNFHESNLQLTGHGRQFSSPNKNLPRLEDILSRDVARRYDQEKQEGYDDDIFKEEEIPEGRRRDDKIEEEEESGNVGQEYFFNHAPNQLDSLFFEKPNKNPYEKWE